MFRPRVQRRRWWQGRTSPSAHAVANKRWISAHGAYRMPISLHDIYLKTERERERERRRGSIVSSEWADGGEKRCRGGAVQPEEEYILLGARRGQDNNSRRTPRKIIISVWDDGIAFLSLYYNQRLVTDFQINRCCCYILLLLLLRLSFLPFLGRSKIQEFFLLWIDFIVTDDC